MKIRETIVNGVLLLFVIFVLYTMAAPVYERLTKNPTPAEIAAKNRREVNQTVSEINRLYERLSDYDQEAFLIQKLSFIAADGEEEAVLSIARQAIQDRREFEQLDLK